MSDSEFIELTVSKDDQEVFSFKKVLERLKLKNINVSQLFQRIVKCADGSFTPYLHQIVPLFTEDNLLITTKTGSGKTAAALLRFLAFEEHKDSFFIYPTNALIEDQLRSISDLLEEFNVKYSKIEYDDSKNNNLFYVPLDTEVVLIPLTGDILSKWQRKLKKKTKGSTLKYIFSKINTLNENIKRIYLLNPDILFLLLILKYYFDTNRTSSYHYLRPISFAVIDEFHLYTGVTLTKLIASLIFEREYLSGFKSILILSATPDEQTSTALSKIFKIKHLDVKNPSSYISYIGGDLEGLKPTSNASRIIAHKVNVHMQIRSEDILDDLEKLLEKFYNEKKYITTVILNSVLETKYVESMIYKIQKDKNSIFSKFKIIPYRGLMSKNLRNLNELKKIKKNKEYALVLGTSAIEVGVNFDTDALIMECSEADSVIQRFGRAGRHHDAEVYMLLQVPKFYELKKIFKNQSTINREDFLNILNDVFDKPKKYSWFLETAHAAAILDIFFEREMAFINDSVYIKLIKNQRKDIIEQYMNKFNINKESYEDIKIREWYNKYISFVSLRGGLPSLWVLDKLEANLGRSPFYRVDVGFLIKRTERTYNKKIVMTYYKKFKHQIPPELENIIKKSPESIPIISFKQKRNIQLSFPKWSKNFFNEIIINGVQELCLHFYDASENDPTLLNELRGHIFMVLDNDDYLVTDWRIQKIKFRYDPDYRGFIVFDDDAILYEAYLEKK